MPDSPPTASPDMSLREYYEYLKAREEDYPSELCQGYEAILWDIEEILGEEHA